MFLSVSKAAWAKQDRHARSKLYGSPPCGPSAIAGLPRSERDLIEAGDPTVGGSQAGQALAHHADGLPAGISGGVEFFAHVRQEQNTLGRCADGLGDAPVGADLPLMADVGVEIA